MARGGQTYYYHYDGLGSTRLLTDAAGAITDTYDYDAFGNQIASTGTTENAFLFTGQQYDANIGFYYLRARYYQPDTGRFTALDPFSGDPYAPMSLHKYLYAADDPVSSIDPSGRMSVTMQMTALSMLVTLSVMAIYVNSRQNVNSATVATSWAQVLAVAVTAFAAVPNAIVGLASDSLTMMKERVDKEINTIRNELNLWQLIIMMFTGPQTIHPSIYTPATPPAGPFIIYEHNGTGYRVLGARLKNRATGENRWIMRVDYHPHSAFPGYDYTLHYHMPEGGQGGMNTHHFLWPAVLTVP